MSKDKKSKKSAPAPPPPPDEPEIPPDIRNININIRTCEFIKPTYSATDITVKAQFMKNDLWESPKIPVTDDDNLLINCDFDMPCDLNSWKDIDNLITFPLILTITEFPGELDPEIYDQIKVPQIAPEEPQITCVESAADLSDVLQDDKIDRTTLLEDVSKKSKSKSEDKKKAPDKSDKKDRSVKSASLSSSKKGSKSSGAKSEMGPPSGPHVMGTCCLDFLPLFIGKEEFSEKMVVHQADKVEDDQMVAQSCLPRLSVTVRVNPAWFTEEKKTTILNFTIESAYNLPSIVMTNMQYKLCTHMMSQGKLNPYLTIGANIMTERDREKIKNYPIIAPEDIYSLEATKYRIDADSDCIKNNTNENVKEILNTDVPRIEWNYLKRFFYKGVEQDQLSEYIKMYRNIGLEFIIVPKKEEKEDKKGGKGKEGKGKGAKQQGTDDFAEYFHFMIFIDVSSLLYPGVNRVRVACPFRTFQEPEFTSATGVQESYFFPKPKQDALPPVVYKPSTKGGGKEKGKKGEEAEKKNLNPLLPPPPPPEPEPSSPVYNDTGMETFIIIEIELLRPIYPKRKVEDLTKSLQEIIPKRPPLPKVIMDSVLAEEIYKETIKKLTTDLSAHYELFLEERGNCLCEIDGHEQNYFLQYLEKTGVYQTYLTSVMKAVSTIVDNKFIFKGETNLGNKDYQNFIADVYCYLVEEMNEVLNTTVNHNINKQYQKQDKELDKLYFYAKETTAINMEYLARNYYLRRICLDERNPNCWFDFAVFNLEMEDNMQAMECVQEALGVDPDHYYSLMLYGILLAQKGIREKAETCFLSAVVGNSTWPEGWGVLYLFYTSIGNTEGADFSLQMATKYLDNKDFKIDYFNSVDDLPWTMSICPNTIFFRTAVFLLKLRAYELAEIALSYEMIKKCGICEYYLAVIQYLKGDCGHALAHLQQARKLYGLDYAVLSLEGHCYLAMNKICQAKENYIYIIESYNRPEDIHLVYVNLAMIYKYEGDDINARKTMLLACKLSPTFYTWFMTGLFFFESHDFISAEECLTQANLCDNLLPEVWAYLTLVNLHLGRDVEANMCYAQTIKNELNDKFLLEKIEKAMASRSKDEYE